MSSAKIRALRDEATERFVGSGGIEGVGMDDSGLIVLLADQDAASIKKVTAWASDRKVPLTLVVSGHLRATG
jgi:hypothetical protein